MPSDLQRMVPLYGAFVRQKEYTAYRDSNVWRCLQSESEAHFWRVDERRRGVCRYCGARRTFAGQEYAS